MQLSLLLALTIASFAAASPVAARGGDVTVKPGQSIQKAINNARAGSRIVVLKGEYKEQLTISKNGIELVGKDATLLPPAEAVKNTCTDLVGPSTNAGICVTGKGVVLGDFPGQEHRPVLSVERKVKDVQITGFTVKDFSGLGVAVLGADNTIIKDNVLVNGGFYGVLTHFSTNSEVKQNKVQSPEILRFIGICTDDNGPSKVRGNTVSGYGIGLCVQTNGAEYINNNVTNACAGAFIDPGINARVVGNDIGAPNPTCLTTFGFVSGILIFGAKDSEVLRNTIRDQKAGGQAAGISLVDAPDAVATGNVVRGNVLVNNDFDIFVNTTGADNVVRNNRCTLPANLCT